ncbi:MAG: hypothetical protein LBG52_04170 [Candidatus Peribacteria bacterium]|jgi:transposase|nr:hypothetical protein [Candidatus Peribacteria bacterium]
MENELETLIRKVAIDKTDFDNKIQNVQKVARYTKEELDQIEVVKMDMNILNIERKLLVVKELLKNPELTTLEIKSLSMDKKGLERELSESKRTMNNYLNTGNKEVSRTTQLFN